MAKVRNNRKLWLIVSNSGGVVNGFLSRQTAREYKYTDERIIPMALTPAQQKQLNNLSKEIR